VPADQHRKALFYGKQLVPISTESEAILKGSDPSQLENGDVLKCFKLLGFSHKDSIPRHHHLDGVDVVLPATGKANLKAFAALVTQMIDTNSVGIAKMIQQKNGQPKLVGLMPYISKGVPILYNIHLPLREDLRDF